MYSSRWPVLGTTSDPLVDNLYVQKNTEPYSILPLNNIPNCVGAYSVRLLRSAYSGFAINLRRSSDNSQVDVSFDSFGVISGNSTVSAGGNLSTWAGASDLFVTKWYDQSGSGFDVAQVSAGSQFRFLINGGPLLNDRPVLSGSPATRTLSGSAPTYFSTPNDLTHSIVYSNPSNTGVLTRISNSAMLIRTSTLSTLRMTMRVYNSANVVNLQTSVSGIVSPGKGGDLVYVVMNQSVPVVKSWENGKLIMTNSGASPWVNTSTPPPSYIIGDTGWIGNVAEVLFFSAALNNSQAQTISLSQTNFYKTS